MIALPRRAPPTCSIARRVVSVNSSMLARVPGASRAALAMCARAEVLPLAFGMFAYERDPAVLRDMLRTAPALPRFLLPRIAPRVFTRRAVQVHGTPRP